jgi:hypothetical protein
MCGLGSNGGSRRKNHGTVVEFRGAVIQKNETILFPIVITFVAWGRASI